MIVCAKPVDRSKGPGQTFVACDACNATCEASKVAGTRGEATRARASALAKAAGWKDRMVADHRPRARRMTWTIEVLCPDCAAKGGGA